MPIPTIAAHTLVLLREVAFPKIPHLALPSETNIAYRLDYGPNWRNGILTVQPPHVGKPFPVLVPQVDADGNELGGIHLPEISVPLATYTGWNLRDPSIGGPSQRVAMVGSYLPFPKNAAERSRATRASRSPSAIRIARHTSGSSRVPPMNSSSSVGFCPRIVHPCCSAAEKSGTRSRTRLRAEVRLRASQNAPGATGGHYPDM